jgi:LacI family transcriptional regulator
MSKRSGGPTIIDIAQRAGVHQGTVSIVLNGGKSQTRVSDATRERIRKIAEEMQYTPNVTARGLRNVRFNCIGVSCSYGNPFMAPDPVDLANADIADYYGASLLSGILRVAHASGYNVMHFHKTWRDAKQSAAGFRGQGIDGFLVIAPPPGSDMVIGLSALGIPVVAISASSDQHHVPSVDVDNAAGVRLALEHLIGLGHRRIGHVMISSEEVDPLIRRASFTAVLRDHGIPVHPDHVVVDAAYRDEQMRRLLIGPEPPTAIFANDDRIAKILMLLAREIGMRVPEDLSIVGFDDSPAATLMDPPLTTVRQPLVRMAEKAASLLIALVESETVPTQTHIFDPSLVVRGSTAPPR